MQRGFPYEFNLRFQRNAQHPHSRTRSPPGLFPASLRDSLATSTRAWSLHPPSLALIPWGHVMLVWICCLELRISLPAAGFQVFTGCCHGVWGGNREKQTSPVLRSNAQMGRFEKEWYLPWKTFLFWQMHKDENQSRVDNRARARVIY